MAAHTASAARPDVLSIQLLGGFHVAIGSWSISTRAWQVRTTRSLVKLLALTPATACTASSSRSCMPQHSARRASMIACA